jgi:ring-1,2-phenylacetyl-CoA epoxidase subunit PaaE
MPRRIAAKPAFHSLAVAEVRHETEDCISVAFEVPAALAGAYSYRPGQYLTLRTCLEGEEVRRSYSICSGLDEAELRVAIKRLPGGAFSAWAHEDLRAGERLDVMTPDGRFGVPIEPGSTRRLAAFAAGSGITPILSIMRTVLARERGHFSLFYGNRSMSSIMFRGQIEDLKDRFLSRLSVFHVLSRERQDIEALNGWLDPDKLRLLTRSLVPAGSVAHVFLCGPQPMLEGLEKTLMDLGFPRDGVHVERFTPGVGGRARPVRVPEDAAAVAIAEVIFEGARTRFPVAAGEAIVDAGHRAGLNLPYSCKGGMCCTCRAKLLDGRVDMTVNYSLEPWETEAGYVLTCQAKPVSERVVVDYDQV